MLRPRVRDLEFHLYSRPVHPELFQTFMLRTVQKDDYQISVRLTPSGHVLTFRNPLFWLTEVTSVRNQPLPSHGHLMGHRFHGERNDTLHPIPEFRYCTTTQVESLSEVHFEKVQSEIISDGSKSGLLFRFNPQNRLFLTPVSYMSVQAGRGILSITALHTFPSENTVVKTISLIEKS